MVSREKIIRDGGAYDTKKYRYVIGRDGNVLRCRLDYLGTDLMYIPHYEPWQPAERRYEEVF